MSIFGILKKNKKQEEEKKTQKKKANVAVKKSMPKVGQKIRKTEKKIEKRTEAKLKKSKPASEAKLKRSSNVNKAQGSIQKSDAWKILASPHVTEKASRLAEENHYMFRVFPRAKKIEIKKAVENIYNVDVEAVKIINVLPRKRRMGRTTGMTKGYKKAIVTINKDQEIEILPR